MSVTNIADPGQLTRDADVALERIAAARSEIGSVIFGQERVVDLTLATLLAGGHDPSRCALDALSVGHGCASELHHDSAGHPRESRSSNRYAPGWNP